MFDALVNFIVYLQDCIEESEDPEEISRLECLLGKAKRIQEGVYSGVGERVPS